MNTAVILAGGRSTRMGRDKLKLVFGGETLLEAAVRRFSQCFNSVYISVADDVKYQDINAARIVDIYPGAGPISGLYAALKTLPGDGVFLTAADLPYALPETALRIIELCGDMDVCVIRQKNGYLEPLFAYYKKTLLGLCEDSVKAGKYRMSGLIAAANTRYIDPGELGELWQEKLLLNINYPEDYEKLQTVWQL